MARIRAMGGRVLTVAFCMIVSSAASAGETPSAVTQAGIAPPAPFIRESTYNQDPSAGKLRGRTMRLKRGYLFVKDLERSLKFYVDILGLEVYSIPDTYNRNPRGLGIELWNIDPNSRRRLAMLNTSDEVRGLAIAELRDMEWNVQQRPRTSTLMFETDDLLGIVARAKAAGHHTTRVEAEEVPATGGMPALRFVECGVIDPDGHVITLYQSFPDDESWRRVKAEYGQP